MCALFDNADLRMINSPMRLILVSLCAIGLSARAAAASAALSAENASQKPTLIVAIAVDQFSAGIFDQYRNRFK